ncbi:hypothetical protein PR202_ga12210 [Eleusine coracana subsp. coracana]|uniref:Bet v I/Major latex protein domain-containing protein n=1 Tax=Eleusine coracana subsp. coracana TaxID=191504 RepID=A0AAV5CBI2_ELECO|nr:hypothetical protein QOZ80_5AG0393550 [Eleusine coracana subsp. coracana]GJM95472.1 hypothetical protein PR202_ga12210 [Eleusine coracana subsp. coracana]
MVAGSFSDEVTVAMPADRLWKIAFTEFNPLLLPKACAGFIESVEVEGDGGPGTVTTMKFTAAVEDAKVFKTRVVATDHAARVVRSEVLEGGKVSSQLSSEMTEMKVEPAGEAACVVKITVQYERDGGELPPEDQAKLAQGYLSLIKKVEEYLVAHPEELA